MVRWEPGSKPSPMFSSCIDNIEFVCEVLYLMLETYLCYWMTKQKNIDSKITSMEWFANRVFVADPHDITGAVCEFDLWSLTSFDLWSLKISFEPAWFYTKIECESSRLLASFNPICSAMSVRISVQVRRYTSICRTRGTPWDQNMSNDSHIFHQTHKCLVSMGQQYFENNFFTRLYTSSGFRKWQAILHYLSKGRGKTCIEWDWRSTLPYLAPPWARMAVGYAPVAMNGRINISCSYDGNPSPTVEWLFNGAKLTVRESWSLIFGLWGILNG